MSGTSSGFQTYPFTKQVLTYQELNAAFASVYALMANMQGTIAYLQQQVANGFPTSSPQQYTVSFNGVTTITNGLQTFTQSAPNNETIVSVTATIGSGTGSFYYTILNAGVPVVGLSNILVNNSASVTTYATGNNTLLQGTILSAMIAGITGSPVNSALTINTTVVQANPPPNVLQWTTEAGDLMTTESGDIITFTA